MWVGAGEASAGRLAFGLALWLCPFPQLAGNCLPLCWACTSPTLCFAAAKERQRLACQTEQDTAEHSLDTSSSATEARQLLEISKVGEPPPRRRASPSLSHKPQQPLLAFSSTCLRPCAAHFFCAPVGTSHLALRPAFPRTHSPPTADLPPLPTLPKQLPTPAPRTP